MHFSSTLVRDLFDTASIAVEQVSNKPRTGIKERDSFEDQNFLKSMP
jgi:hypothetical protein